MNKNIGIAAVGSVLDIDCWGGSPYYFYQAGAKQGLFNEPWELPLKEFKIPRQYWNIRQVLLGKGKGGFQYSKSFLDLAESKIPQRYFSSTIISFNQLFPRGRSIKSAGGKIFYYIDTTLFHLFNEQEYGINIPKSMALHALAQERKNYEDADGVITWGNWVHNSLIDFYKLPKEKLFQVLPGTNMELPRDFTVKPKLGIAGKERELILGFVGKDWKRKGLLFLLDVQSELVRMGYKVRIRAIGNCPDELKNAQGLEYVGHIDKKNELLKFVEALSSCDIGCLFSKSEALGISTLEFLRVGIPVTGFYHQGLMDTLIEGASLRFDISQSPESVAKYISRVIETNQLEELKKGAKNFANKLTWTESVSQIIEIINK